MVKYRVIFRTFRRDEYLARATHKHPSRPSLAVCLFDCDKGVILRGLGGAIMRNESLSNFASHVKKGGLYIGQPAVVKIM